MLQGGRTKGLMRLKEGFKFWQIELRIQVRGVPTACFNFNCV